jgi:hypothetical protein
MGKPKEASLISRRRDRNAYIKCLKLLPRDRKITVQVGRVVAR